MSRAMSRDSYGATERRWMLNALTKILDSEYSISGVFGSALNEYNRSVAP